MTLSRRITISATLVLVVFITLTAAALDRAFVKSAESALSDKLTSHLYALMAAAEVDKDGVTMPLSQLDALLGLPSSGMYAFITGDDGKIFWQSSSAIGASPPEPLVLDSGDKRFVKSSVSGVDYYTFAYGVSWAIEDLDGDMLEATVNLGLTFNIITDLKSFDKQIYRYRKTLWGWLVAMALLLLVSQAFILRWGLSPLRQVGEELNRIESGDQDDIQDVYPQEIERLTGNINTLLRQEREQKTRYRNALGDLAHSLKTPLAVLQSGLQSNAGPDDDDLQQQVMRMNSIVEYQLQRAATAGSVGIGKTVNVKTVVDRMLESLQKVYRDKNIALDVQVDASLVFKGDEGDLMELLGNLLDNAFKWCAGRVDVVSMQQDDKLCFRIMDDGPGFEPAQIDDLLQRGKRADEAVPGHGIGLSIVQNIVQAYHGSLRIAKSASGGAEVVVEL